MPFPASQPAQAGLPRGALRPEPSGETFRVPRVSYHDVGHETPHRFEQGGSPMKKFKAGDRVRVRAVRAVGSFAGQVGTVVKVSDRRSLDGTPDSYRVLVDMALPTGR